MRDRERTSSRKLEIKINTKNNTKMRYCTLIVVGMFVENKSIEKKNSSNRTLTHITLLAFCLFVLPLILTNTGSCKQIINKPPAKNHVSTGEVVRGKNPIIVFALRCVRWIMSSFSTISHSTLKFYYEIYFVLYFINL